MKPIKSAIASVAPLAIATTAHASTGYELIDPPNSHASEASVDVTEFYWFGCPHCFSFEPRISDSEKSAPEGVKLAGITGVPVILIDGRFRTGTPIAGGNAATIRVIELLTTEALKSREPTS